MGFLFSSILVASCIYIIFRYFSHFGVNNENAILINYLLAFLFGLLLNGKDILNIPRNDLSWIIPVVILGILFVVVFHIMARSTQIAGISISSVAGRMSVIIPMSFSILYYNEPLSILKIVAILMAPLAVFLVVVKKDMGKEQAGSISLPVLLFLGTGIIDSLIKYSQGSHLENINVLKFSTYLFLVAAITSLFTRSWYSLGGIKRISLKDIIGGSVLGIINFGSISLIILALQKTDLDSSLVFGMNNIGVILIAVLAGSVLFREKLEPVNRAGIMIAIITLFLLYKSS